MALWRSLPWLHKPHPVLVYNKKRFFNFDQSKPLHEYSFVVCDTELTGLNKRKDEIISIGAVRIVNLQVELSQTFHCYTKPVNIDSNQATLIHRITPERLKTAPSIEDVLPEFIQFCGDSLIVGHFIGIDMHFLNKAARQTLAGTLSNPSIDTMRLARGYEETQCKDFYGSCDYSSSYNLDSLSEKFFLPRFKPHDALEDALQTAYLFLFLIKKFKHGGIRSLKDLYRVGRIRGLVS